MAPPTTPKPFTVAHVAINADDVEKARGFYEAVFDWTFEAWGPPEFFQVTTVDGSPPGPMVALQGRRDLLSGQRTIGFEATVSVPDVDATAKAVEANGGTILMEKTTIAGVGDLIFFADPSGNVCGAMQYDLDAG